MGNADRVRANTTEAINRQIDFDIDFSRSEVFPPNRERDHPAYKRA